MKKAITNLLVMLLILEVVSAAPLPWGIAIKENTDECAGYWGGDEYFSYTLPSGWKAYYPDSTGTILTDFGSCSLRKDAGDPPGAEEKCCNELGLVFISENIGENHGIWQLFYPPTIFWTICIVLVFAFLFWIIFQVIKRVLKKLRKR